MARRKRARRGRDQPRHRFRSRPGDPGTQAAAIVKRLQGGRIRSVGTARNYQQWLVQIAVRLDVSLTALTPEGAVAYLQRRAAEVGQKTLDMERQAMKAMMVDVTGRMAPGQTLPIVKSATSQQLKPRAYSPAQVRAIVVRQDHRKALATEIVYASGIRAHELLTLGRADEQPPDDRRGQSRLTGTAAEGMKFAGRNGVVYTVEGKGGLIREVLLPHPCRGARSPPSPPWPGVPPPRTRWCAPDADRRRCGPRRGCRPRSGAHPRGWPVPRCRGRCRPGDRAP